MSVVITPASPPAGAAGRPPIDRWTSRPEAVVVRGLPATAEGLDVRCPRPVVEGRGAAASFRQIARAWYAFLRDGEFIEWRTEPVPEGATAQWVVFYWGMGCGQAAPSYGADAPPGLPRIASPAEPFDLFIEGRYLLSFCDQRWPSRWEACPRDPADLPDLSNTSERPAPRLVFEPRYVRTNLGEEIVASGVALLALPAAEVPTGRPLTLRIQARVADHPRKLFGWTPNRRWVRLEQPAPPKGVQLDSGLDLLLGERPTQRAGADREYGVWWGDIHGHSHFPPCGMCTAEDFYPYARGVANLDFVCLTDHDGVARQTTMTDELWRDRVQRAARWTTPGRFTALDGYEWTNFAYGHRNVYFNCEDPPLFRWVDPHSDTPEKLWARLREHKLEGKAITGAHHVAVLDYPVDWRFHDPVFDRFVEIHSGWGCFEYAGHPYAGMNSDVVPGTFVQDALARGYRLGILASGDSHFGQPGNSSTMVEVPTIGAGLVAALAPENTRSSIFDALYQRRVYGTTGAPIVLDFRADGHSMGSEFVVEARARLRGPSFYLRVGGVAALESVELIREGRVIAAWPGAGMTGEFEFADGGWEEAAGAKGWTYYYARVRQADGHLAWSSPVWVQR